MKSPSLLSAESLSVDYRIVANDWLGKSQLLRAVRCVDLSIESGDSVGIVGESGCGKSSLALALMGLVSASTGHVSFEGHDIKDFGRDERRRFRQRVQIVFQDPYASLNTRLTVGDALIEPLRFHHISANHRDAAREVSDLLETVGLDSSVASQYPGELSGGQRQRVAIARSLSVRPQVLIADEPVSSLDVSIQAQIIDLLRELRARLGLTLVFISHDLAVVREVCDQVAVMYLGRVVERGDSAEMLHDPRHPYTRALVASVPDPNPLQERKKYDTMVEIGDPPSATDPPSGCHYHTRCPHALDRCSQEVPELQRVAPQTQVACWLYSSDRPEPDFLNDSSNPIEDTLIHPDTRR